MSANNPKAQTPEEHLANYRFQLENIEGYLSVPHARFSAKVKAECLLRSAQALVAAFEAEAGNAKGGQS